VSGAFITAPSGTFTGTGSAAFGTSANVGTARNGTVRISYPGGSQDVAVTQNAPCTYTVSPTTVSPPAAGLTFNVTVNTQTQAAPGCTWTAVSLSSFITVDSPGPGSGSGVASFTVAPNSGPFRTGTVQIQTLVANITVTVRQSAGSVSPLLLVDVTPAPQSPPFPAEADKALSWIDRSAFDVPEREPPGSVMTSGTARGAPIAFLRRLAAPAYLRRE
jgi:hypothetical protein